MFKTVVSSDNVNTSGEVITGSNGNIGFVKIKNQNGDYHYLCIDSYGNLCVNATIPDQYNLGSVIGTPTNSLQTYDGTYNHSYNYGKVGDIMGRYVNAIYSDTGDTFEDGGEPNPRDVSNAICDQPGSNDNPDNMSSMFWLWGQFMDHMIVLTNHNDESITIDVTGDSVYDPGSAGKNINMSRSEYFIEFGKRQQRNYLSSFIDATAVYGSNETRLNFLRTGTNGLMKLTNNLPPLNTEGLPNAVNTTDFYYVVGDVRGNEHLALTAFHTLWVREHNYWAAQFLAANPTWSDEQIFQKARRYVISEIQAINYNEFLPVLLGESCALNAYDADVDTRIYNEFATSAYRYGHTMVTESTDIRNPTTGALVNQLALDSLFFNPTLLKDGTYTVGQILLGFVKQLSQKLDEKITGSMRNALVGGDPFDLASLNIKRNREHGIAKYHQVKDALLGGTVTGWDDILAPGALSTALQAEYGAGGWNELDLWLGCLVETKQPGSPLGAVAHYIIKDQFQRLRDGDKYFYLWNSELTQAEIDSIDATTLKDVMVRNTTIATGQLPTNVFYIS